VPQNRITNRVRLWRATAGYTLEEVADLTGISASVLSRVERGQRGLKPETKVRMARCLGVPVRDLFPPEPVASEAS
jgi:transcriptional regulator with XRE-family HTH domain